MQYQVIIIGGGAAGLVAAIAAAKQKQSILIIEKNKSLGRKILVTGNGRCNLTNINVSPDKYYGENTKCLHNIFNQFSFEDTIRFFNGLGVKTKTESNGRVFPATDKASTVLDGLLKEVSRLQIKSKLNERVARLDHTKTNWLIKTDLGNYHANSVILTTGGKSYPQLGSTGDGYDISQKLRHRIIEPKQALVPLEWDGAWDKELQGIQVNVIITVKQHKKLTAQKTGDLLFTHFGISGPVVLDLSRIIVSSLNKPDYALSINFFPNHNRDELIAFIKQRPRKTLINTLSQLLPQKLCHALLGQLKIDADKQTSQLTKKEMQLITSGLIDWQIRIKKPRSFKESMVTAGGISMDEVNPKTMESLKAKGLYFAGEIMDIDGISGGYNLQFAWSTGYLAGLSASRNK
jgi:predicted Rossmann fold flavoprotein